MLATQKQPRFARALPVRIWGVDANSQPFAQLATTKDISQSGACLDGVRRPLKLGEILHVQYGDLHAEYQVIWTGQRGTPLEGLLGLECLPLQPCIWDTYLSRAAEVVGNG